MTKENIAQIEAVLFWLSGEAKDQRDMQESINTERPNFNGSEEEGCWKMHESNLLHIELAQKHLQVLLSWYRSQKHD